MAMGLKDRLILIFAATITWYGKAANWHNPICSTPAELEYTIQKSTIFYPVGGECALILDFSPIEYHAELIDRNASSLAIGLFEDQASVIEPN
jgi:hypothetical protein